MNFMGYFYDFIIDYDAIAVDYVLDIQRYLKKRIIYERNDIIKMFDFIKKIILVNKCSDGCNYWSICKIMCSLCF